MWAVLPYLQYSLAITYLTQHNIHHFANKPYIFSLFSLHSGGTSKRPIVCVTVHHSVTIRQGEKGLRPHMCIHINISIHSGGRAPCIFWNVTAEEFPNIWGAGELLSELSIETTALESAALKDIWCIGLPIWRHSQISYSEEGDLLTTSCKNAT